MTNFVIEPPAQASLPIQGSDDRFPVRRVYCVGRNYAAHSIEMGGDPLTAENLFDQGPVAVSDGRRVYMHLFGVAFAHTVHDADDVVGEHFVLRRQGEQERSSGDGLQQRQDPRSLGFGERGLETCLKAPVAGTPAFIEIAGDLVVLVRKVQLDTPINLANLAVL